MSILDDRKPEPLGKPAGDDSPGLLFAIAAFAFFAYWVFTPGLYQLVTGHSLAPTTQTASTQAASTQPASQPAPEINPHDLAALSIACPIVGLITLFAANASRIKHPLQKVGFTWWALRQGGLRVGLTATIIVVPAMFAVVFLTEKFWVLVHYAHPSEHDLLRVLGVEPNRAIRAAIIVSAIVLAPMFEEFFFRGMIQRALQIKTQHRWVAIVTTSMVFTAVHGAIWLAPPIFFLSLCLGYVYARTRNLWVPMIVHAAFNASSLIMFLLAR